MINLPNNLKKYLIPSIFAICATLFSLGNTYNSDEGTVLNGAWKMFNGKHLYTDFFSFAAPGSYVWTEWSFVLMGPSYISARIFAILLLMASAYCIFRIGSLMGSKKVGITAATFWMIASLLCVVVVNYNPLSSYLAIIALSFLASAMDKNKTAEKHSKPVIARSSSDEAILPFEVEIARGRGVYPESVEGLPRNDTIGDIFLLSQNVSVFFFISGFFFGAVTFFLQSKGLVLNVGILLLLFIFSSFKYIRWRSFVIFTLGMSVLLIFAIFSWGGPFLYQLLIQWPTQHYFAVNQVSYIPWIISLVLCAMLTVLILLRHKNIDKKLLIILTAIQFLLLISTLHRPDLFHIVWNSPIIILFVSYLLHHILNPDKAYLFLIELPLMLMLTLSVVLAITALKTQNLFRHAVNETVGLTPKVYAHPFLPHIYFELGVNDPYTYDILLTDMYPTQAFNENLTILKKEEPEYVFLNYATVSKFFYHKQNVLDAYIADNYTHIKHIGSMDIMKKNQR